MTLCPITCFFIVFINAITPFGIRFKAYAKGGWWHVEPCHIAVSILFLGIAPLPVISYVGAPYI